MGELVGEGAVRLEEEPPDQLARNVRAAGHLWTSATAFFFLAFVFAYFYLRSLNSGGMWRPAGVDPSVALGTLSAAGAVAFALLVRVGLAEHRAGRSTGWRRAGAAALVAGLLSIAFQIAEWAAQGFGPTDGGYASVFVGWTGFYTLFLVGAVYWLETVLATSLRSRGGSDDSVRPGLEAVAAYSTFLAGLAVLSWIVLYLV